MFNTVFWLASIAIGTPARAAADQPVVEVFLPPTTIRDLSYAFYRAKGIVHKAYADIGVRVIWRSVNSAPASCMQKPMHRQIVFELRTSPRDRHPSVLAYANPYSPDGPCVTLLMDRLQAAVERNPETTGLLLGHVLAHEIGHVLQGISRHSETGIMKQAWSHQEIADMWRARLRFTSTDAQLILEPFRSIESARAVQ